MLVGKLVSVNLISPHFEHLTSLNNSSQSPLPSISHHHHVYHSTSTLLLPPPHGPVLCSQQYSHSGLSSQPPHTQLTSSAAHILPHIHTTLDTHSRTLSLGEGLTFSPLTSSEFREDQPPGYSSLVMRSYDKELNNILDIAGLPTGSEAGFGSLRSNVIFGSCTQFLQSNRLTP